MMRRSRGGEETGSVVGKQEMRCARKGEGRQEDFLGLVHRNSTALALNAAPAPVKAHSV
jgi:hypothetical protein